MKLGGRCEQCTDNEGMRTLLTIVVAVWVVFLLFVQVFCYLTVFHAERHVFWVVWEEIPFVLLQEILEQVV